MENQTSPVLTGITGIKPVNQFKFEPDEELLIQLKDGRYMLGKRYKSRGQVFFAVIGDNIREGAVSIKDVDFWQPVKDVISIYTTMLKCKI